MSDKSFLNWPFFEDQHRALAIEFEHWVRSKISSLNHDDVDATCRELVANLGDAGWLNHSSPDPYDHDAKIDVRTLCIIRETLARYSGLADFSFAMQGLGAGAIALFGSWVATIQQRHDWWVNTWTAVAVIACSVGIATMLNSSLGCHLWKPQVSSSTTK